MLKVKNLTKFYEGQFGSKIQVLDNINFFISESDGKVTSILAPYESGKSTLLKIIAGIDESFSGEITFNNKNIIDVTKTEVVFIPEEPSSFPWLNVKDNILFVEKIQNIKIDDEELKKLIALVGLGGYENHFPHKSSLGFRFRISLARALALKPKLILIDDSFKKMSLEIRHEMISLIKKVTENFDMRILIATTNIKEAISISDKIFLMEGKPGKIVKEFTVTKNTNDFGQLDFKVYESIRNEIENYFKSQNKFDVINFSI